MTEPPFPASPIRGAIRVSIKNSTDNVDAGQEFSVFVNIQNPFEVPLTVHRVSTHIPVEFFEVGQRQRAQQLREFEQRLDELDEVARDAGLFVSEPLLRRQGQATGFFNRLRHIRLGGIEMSLGPPVPIGPAIARDLTVESAQISASIPLVGNISYTIPPRVADAQPDPAALRNALEEENKRLAKVIDTLRAPESVSLSLQPGNSTARVFTMRSARSIWFKPASYRLQIEIEYEIGGVRNVDTVEHVLQIKASLISIIFGALIGAFGGWLVKNGSTAHADMAHFTSAAISLVFAAMVVVLFARKKDIQPLIAIEDFWGGVAIGFLASYTGQEVIGRILPPTTVPNSL